MYQKADTVRLKNGAETCTVFSYIFKTKQYAVVLLEIAVKDIASRVIIVV